jgi:hypothetical protein
MIDGEAKTLATGDIKVIDAYEKRFELTSNLWLKSSYEQKYYYPNRNGPCESSRDLTRNINGSCSYEARKHLPKSTSH